VLTRGRPSGARRKARRRVVSDQVAVPSRSRSGARRNSRRMRARSAGPYRTGGPPPCRVSSAASPSRLNRATSRATPSPERRPARRAAVVYDAPAATASSALARPTRSARSLVARATAPSTTRSSSVNARKGSFCRRAIPLLPRCRRNPAQRRIPELDRNGKAHAN
jgi:hypothetical protein